MNGTSSNWKLFGFFACALSLGVSLQAQTALPTVNLLATDPTALEGTSGGSFTLIRHGDTNSPLSVTVAISGTASNGVDYATIDSVLTLPAGYLAIDVPVQPILDTVNRGNKTVVLTVQSNAAYRVAGRAAATVKIVDDVFDIPPPTVSITSPTDGTAFTSPAQITLQADVSDPDITVQSVSFYANDAFLGRATNSPYSIVWTKPRNGHYAIFARAVDQLDKSAVSPAIHITVSETPVVTLSLPNGTNYSVGQFVELDAQIGDPNESIKGVSFYVNGKVVGTVTSAPYSLDWTATTIGNYQLQAVVTDQNTGKTGSSQKIGITVTPFLGGN